MNEPIVLFDGVCTFCDGTINFLLDHDTAHRLRYAALQSHAGQALLERFGLRTDNFDTIVLVEHGRAYLKSSAALRIACLLGGGWSLLAVLFAIPPFVRDGVYDFIARNRYRWFGRLDACRIPTPAVRARFLD